MKTNNYLERTVLHLNVADFAVAVERLSESGLHDRPVIVAPQGAAWALGYSGIALTDTDNLYDLWEFLKACHLYHLHPAVGAV